MGKERWVEKLSSERLIGEVWCQAENDGEDDEEDDDGDDDDDEDGDYEDDDDNDVSDDRGVWMEEEK